MTYFSKSFNRRVDVHLPLSFICNVTSPMEKQSRNLKYDFTFNQQDYFEIISQLIRPHIPKIFGPNYVRHQKHEEISIERSYNFKKQTAMNRASVYGSISSRKIIDQLPFVLHNLYPTVGNFRHDSLLIIDHPNASKFCLAYQPHGKYFPTVSKVYQTNDQNKPEDYEATVGKIVEKFIEENVPLKDNKPKNMIAMRLFSYKIRTLNSMIDEQFIRNLKYHLPEYVILQKNTQLTQYGDQFRLCNHQANALMKIWFPGWFDEKTEPTKLPAYINQAPRLYFSPLGEVIVTGSDAYESTLYNFRTRLPFSSIFGCSNDKILLLALTAYQEHLKRYEIKQPAIYNVCLPSTGIINLKDFKVSNFTYVTPRLKKAIDYTLRLDYFGQNTKEFVENSLMPPTLRPISITDQKFNNLISTEATFFNGVIQSGKFFDFFSNNLSCRKSNQLLNEPNGKTVVLLSGFSKKCNVARLSYRSKKINSIQFTFPDALSSKNIPKWKILSEKATVYIARLIYAILYSIETFKEMDTVAYKTKPCHPSNMVFLVQYDKQVPYGSNLIDLVAKLHARNEFSDLETRQWNKNSNKLTLDYLTKILMYEIKAKPERWAVGHNGMLSKLFCWSSPVFPLKAIPNLPDYEKLEFFKTLQEQDIEFSLDQLQKREDSVVRKMQGALSVEDLDSASEIEDLPAWDKVMNYRNQHELIRRVQRNAFFIKKVPATIGYFFETNLFLGKIIKFEKKNFYRSTKSVSVVNF